ncbi:MAG: hypothetical protein WA908_02055, partial [Pontixanthobacter sp.]
MAILRSLLLYVVWFFITGIVVTIVLNPLPDVIEGLVIIIAPIFIVRWFNKRRRERLETENAIDRSPAEQDQQGLQSQVPHPPEPRTVAEKRIARRLAASRERANRATASARERPRPERHGKSLDRPEDPTFSEPEPQIVDSESYRPRQDNSVLIAAGRAARDELARAAVKYAKPTTHDMPLRGAQERIARQIGSISARSSKVEVEDAPRSLWQKAAQRASQAVDDASASKPYRPKQDNAALIAAGKVARARQEHEANEYARNESISLSVDEESETEEMSERGRLNKNGFTTSDMSGWIAAGQSVEIAGRSIPGMVYVGTPPQVGESYYRSSSRAFIVPSLHVHDGRGRCRA